MNEIEIKEMESTLKNDNLYQVWEIYKSFHNLELTKEQDRDILAMLVVNGLNPFKRDAFIIKYNKNSKNENGQWQKKPEYNIVVAYQTLIRKVYESGYDSKNVTYIEKKLKTPIPNENGTAFNEIEDLECTVSLTTSKNQTYTFVGLFSQFASKTKEGKLLNVWKEKPILMLRKCVLACLFRTLPNSNLNALPYTKEEIENDNTTTLEVPEVPKIEIENSKYENSLTFLLKKEFISEEKFKELENMLEENQEKAIIEIENLQNKFKEDIEKKKNKLERTSKDYIASIDFLLLEGFIYSSKAIELKNKLMTIDRAIAIREIENLENDFKNKKKAL